jgi:lipopolysaccharide/colanic/teichoic acid biosynthesis glycosyltransferase
MANLRIKRIFDFTAALIGLLLLAPLFLIISLLVKLNDLGPVFFRHRRIGRGGNPFYIYKFRSMKVIESAEDGIFEPGNLSRITLVGKFLRRNKLDELPQLINVIKGDISIVGPRPEVPKWVAVYSDRWQKVLKVKPGITDRASIVFNDEESLLARSDDPEQMYKEVILPIKLDIYEEYVQNNSLSGDLKLILETISCLIRKKGLKQESSLPQTNVY